MTQHLSQSARGLLSVCLKVYSRALAQAQEFFSLKVEVGAKLKSVIIQPELLFFH